MRIRKVGGVVTCMKDYIIIFQPQAGRFNDEDVCGGRALVLLTGKLSNPFAQDHCIPATFGWNSFLKLSLHYQRIGVCLEATS